MPQTYIKLFLDWPQMTERLTLTEKGRLVDAMVAYALGDANAEDQLRGNGKYVFPAFKLQIDRSAASYEATAERNRINGKSGGRPKKTQKNPENPVGFSETQKSQEKEKEKEKDKEKEDLYITTTTTTRAREDAEPPFDTETPEHGIAAYIDQAFLAMTPGNWSELTEIVTTGELPDDVVKYAVDVAVGMGYRRFSTLRQILNTWVCEGIRTLDAAKAHEADRMRKRDSKPARTTTAPANPALAYQQRQNISYDDVFLDLTKEVQTG